jgi:two-component system, NarL family, nitrate/nitrite response regulator NarL
VLLEREGIAVVGTTTTSADALRLEQELQPAVVLVDIRLDGESGFDLARRLRARVILISTHAESEYATFPASAASFRRLRHRACETAFQVRRAS